MLLTRVEYTEPITPSIPFEEFMKPKVVEKEAIEPNVIDITMTRYYPQESSNCTSSTLCIDKFSVNDKGWFTYQGKVVMAGATYICQQYCRDRELYGQFPSDYRIYNLYDEVQFILENVMYDGIILDSCGACMYHINGESLQRYDIFVSNGSASLLTKGNIGKTSAYLIKEKNEQIYK